MEFAHNRPAQQRKIIFRPFNHRTETNAVDDFPSQPLTTPANTVTMASTQSVQCFGKKRNATVRLPRPRPTDCECDRKFNGRD